MASEVHLLKLKEGVGIWNEWRQGIGDDPSLRDADLERMNLAEVNLHRADLSNANLQGTFLGSANLTGANLSKAQLIMASLPNSFAHGAYFRGADLRIANLTQSKMFGANFSSANLSGSCLREAGLSQGIFRFADLSGSILTSADLRDADMTGANLRGANLAFAILQMTLFNDVDLTGAIGLEKCIHLGPSIIDHGSFQKSGELPLPFLRGVGLPDDLIGYLPSIFRAPIQRYSCFISYSAKDQQFSERLYEGLQGKGVRCWFAPHDMRIGDRILDAIDQAIRLRDKLVLVLSERSIKSDWVEDEVTTAFEEERRRGQAVLFPIRLDDAVMDTDEPWAAKLRARHLGDFRRWKEHDEYQKSFARVLRDLTVKKP